MKRNFIFFDFDGVIADSFSPAFEVNKMICPGITEDDYRKRLEGNINEWWEKTTDEKHTDKCRHDIDFFKEYLPKMEKSTIVFPGMKDVIVKLANLYSLIIISSTTTNPIRAAKRKI